MERIENEPLPPYSYVPGGPWPHPTSSPQGHSANHPREVMPPIIEDDWAASSVYLRGVELFNAGYYWEAHEAWEALWHAHGRKGPTADVLKALIKLAAAGVKVREGQVHGIVTHAFRAANLFESAKEAGERRLGLDLDEWSQRSSEIAERPPHDPEPPGAAVSCVFPFRIEPH